MSKTKCKWWGFVKAVIRAYPEHCKELDMCHGQMMTARYDISGVSGRNMYRSAEAAALHDLPPEAMREYNAVDAALRETRRRKQTGAERVKLVDMVFFAKSHTLDGAAYALNVSYGTAKNWHNDFIKLVAKKYGLLDFNEERQAKT